jgi:uncharacterized protein DUF1570
MEKLRAVLVSFKNGEARSPVPTVVLVFRDITELDPYRPLYQGRPKPMGALFLQGHDGNFVALSAGWNLDARPFIYHEYLHDFMRSNFLPQPLWYEEGLAEFYSTFRADEREATVGLPVENHIRRMREGFLIPLDRLFAIDRDSPEYNERERESTFYAESWAVVHYLMRGNRDRTPQLGRYLVALQQGRPRDEAFRESFQTDSTSLLAEVRKYMAGGRFLYSVTKFSDLKIPRETRTERIDPAEALVRMGELLGRSAQERRSDAEAYFREALAEKADCGDALAGIGEIRMWEDKDEEAVESLRKAVETGSAGFRAWFNYGRALLRRLEKSPILVGALTPEFRRAVEDARRAFRKCLELEPGFAEARGALGSSYLVEDAEHAGEGIAALEEAVRLLPSRNDLALNLAMLYERRNDGARSEEIRRRVLGPNYREAASRQLRPPLQEGLDHVNALLKEGRDDEAVALFEEILAKAPEDLRQAYGDELAKLRRGAARNRAVRQFNDAVELARKGDYEGALAGFRKVALAAEDREVAKAAREQAERLGELVKKRPRRPGGKTD